MNRSRKLMEKLRNVKDPCSVANGSNLNIVEMGLVKSLEISEGKVIIEFRLTTPFCLQVPYFSKQIKDQIKGQDWIDSIELNFDQGLEWSHDMMSKEAKRSRRKILESQERRFLGSLSEQDEENP